MALFNSVVGINANQIPNMSQAIDTYINDVKTVLAKLNSDVSTSAAFQGDYATAVKKYVGAVEQVCNTVVGEMSSFKAKLEEIKAAYTTKDKDIGSTIEGSSNTLLSNYNVNANVVNSSQY